mmetsp:Transcript_26937/g.43989  ORF Transcript_26937/g.43989 Transcript_26937/m.43989 type:complete len:513 (-) Transcript_26937:47-1585(-)|eukprot:CAMPEP_0184667790 /NCGR_PEP_ID=MMETSP0308-20130426/69190_1 /TAXON_ID=38269 /ORGANISM="Gloeochaete witrockiana, Strain SAG 46.84" /LENGTH=512 /DNA_ID=CAMNT_0027113181 /DNA_START=15 /DNA_END=1553 /DNA_ORIENTATION=-
MSAEEQRPLLEEHDRQRYDRLTPAVLSTVVGPPTTSHKIIRSSSIQGINSPAQVYSDGGGSQHGQPTHENRFHDRRHSLAIEPDHGGPHLSAPISYAHRASTIATPLDARNAPLPALRSGSFTEKSFLGLPSWDEPGREPGIQDLDSLGSTFEPSTDVKITVYDYGPNSASYENVEPNMLGKFLIKERPKSTVVRWIEMEGLDSRCVQILANRFGFNNLQMEDVFQVPQRPKVDHYPANIFVVLNMLKPGDIVGEGQLRVEQVSLFILSDTVITVSETVKSSPSSSIPEFGFPQAIKSRKTRTDNDVWRLVRERIFDPTLSVRKNDASYLAYALIDAIVDRAFPILEQYQAALENVDDKVLRNPSPEIIRSIHCLERELMVIKRIIQPTLGLTEKLVKTEHVCITSLSQIHLQDVRDHLIQIIDIIENFRDFGARMRELAESMISHRLNEIMKVLTLISTIFIPLSFVAGVYGMNFQNFPEIHWEYGYAYFWCVVFSVVTTMLLYFRQKRWL